MLAKIIFSIFVIQLLFVEIEGLILEENELTNKTLPSTTRPRHEHHKSHRHQHNKHRVTLQDLSTTTEVVTPQI
uniref:Uncharacterized protein n=2 Tax=Meloidogyne TaxID=189290 RepID=A0A6V7XDX4_MELEN|nr:unnamed protein product [Meloidogyne enterolobii]